MMAYCIPKDVLDLTGYEESDFGKIDPGAFEDLVADWIDEADGLIDEDRNRTFDITGADVKHARTLKLASMQITANIMKKSTQFRTSPVAKIDEFTINPPPVPIIDDDVKALLKKLPCAPRIGMAICSPPRRHHSHEGD